MSFSDTVAKWAEDAGATADQALRAAALELLTRTVLRSPVGNPELWAANQHATQGRRAAISEATLNGTRIGRRALEQRFPLQAGKGYVGGRFRGNWQVTLESPAEGDLNTIDAGGSETISAGAQVLPRAQIGAVIWIVNNLPYSEVLEYGHSKQAPTGIVRITAAEFAGIADDAAAGPE